MRKNSIHTSGYNCSLVFGHLPGNYLILATDAPHFTILGFNQKREKATMSDAHMIGKPLFQVFTDNPANPEATGVKNLQASLQQVMRTRQEHAMPMQRYDLLNPQTGVYEERYWHPVNIPVLDGQGAIHCIIHAVEDVTEYMMLQEKEQQSQRTVAQLHQEQQQILENITDGFIATDAAGLVQYWNKAAETIFKINRGRILGKPLLDSLQDSGHSSLFYGLKSAMQQKKPTHFQTDDGDKTLLQVNTYPSDKGLTIFLLDITEQIAAETAIRNTDRKYKALIENIQDGLAIITPEGHLINLSHSGERITGYSAAELGAFPQWEIIHPEDAPTFKNTFQAVCAQPGHADRVTFRLKTKDGHFKWIEAGLQNFVEEAFIQGVVMTFCDITRRKEFEEQLRLSEKQYRHLFNNSPASVIIWTLDDLKIQEANLSASRLYGYTHTELLEKTLLDLCPIEEHERLIARIAEMRLSSLNTCGIWKRQKKNGGHLFMDLVFHPITYKSKQAVMGLGIDVTDRILLQQKLEEERIRRQDEITEAVLTTQENERSELGKELHDNINQILTTSRMFIDHALTKPNNAEELLRQSSKYLGKAIEEIRQLSRTLMPPAIGDFSLKEDLSELFANIKQLKGIAFQFNFSVDPALYLDPKLKLAVFRIVQEKLNNIIKHAHATQVHISVWAEQEQLHLHMQDNGVGFDKDQHLRGMGLRNIQSRAHLLGGQVNISSSKDEGTKLEVSFPLTAA